MESFKDVTGYEGHYKISNFGNIKSIKFDKEKILNQKIKVGYKSINLSLNGKMETHSIHVLLMRVFFGYEMKKGFVIDHIDNVRTNNRLDNLQVITIRDNVTKDRVGSTSKFTGVDFHKPSKTWRCRISINGRSKHLGNFKNEIDAKNSYIKAKKLLQR